MINKLEKFRKVIELENLTKASKELHITQPALTILIKNLEKQFGIKLITKVPKGIIPTEAGKILYKESLALSIKEQDIRKKINNLTNKPQPIKIGMIDNVGYLLFEKITEIAKNQNGSEVEIEVNRTKNLIEDVEKGILDAAIITKVERLPASIEKKLFKKEHFILVSKNSYTNKNELNGQELISYNKQSNTFQLVKNSLEKLNIIPQFSISSSSPEFILNIVLEGIGFAALPENLVSKYIKVKKLKKIENVTIERELFLIKRKENILSSSLNETLGIF
ncbi:MAG TPA: LysR family transcriptional regulator [Candidatus Dojkabacteria bacterium]|jgi:DNA-binding transcriptional LysR family regulator